MNEYGKSVWYEYYTNDTDKALAYYGELFNWTTQSMQIGDAPEYRMFAVGETPVAGLINLSTSRTPEVGAGWLAYISVPDVDAAANAITGNGGSVISEVFDVPTVGRWVIARDPEGTVFSPFQPADGPGESTNDTPPLGHFCWHELMCKDREQMFTFYNSVFSWQASGSHDMGDMGVYQMYSAGDATIGGMMNLTADMGDTSYWAEYVHVDGIDAAVNRSTQLGGTPWFPKIEVNGENGLSYIAGVTDALGCSVAMWSPNA